MAFSGTVSQTLFNTRRLIDRAFGRCRIPSALITSEQIDIAKDELYLLVSEFANYGVPLWCVERQVHALYEGVGDLVLPVGVVDVLSANLRQVQCIENAGTTTVTDTEIETDFDPDGIGITMPVSVVGIKWQGPAVSLALERSDDGLVWTTVMMAPPTVPSPDAGQWSWFDLSPLIASRYFLVRAINSTDTLDIDTLHLANTPTEIPLGRLNRDDWLNLPNKTFPGRPNQYWFDRQVRQPVMHLWSMPDAAQEANQLVLTVHRHIMDVGTLQQEIEVPQRWYNALTAMLAARLAGAVAEVDAGLAPVLDAKGTQALMLAQNEERDNSPINWAPMIGVYTR
jgi:hypothetical protein